MSGSIGDNPYRASGVIASASSGISWQSVVTASTFTAEAGNGYPVNTTSNACTVTLPASASVGDEIIFTDYARNWGTNALTIDQNSLKYQGNTAPNPEYDTDGESIHIVYQDATKGWIPTYDGAVALETPQTYTVQYTVVAGGGAGGSGEQGGGGGAGGLRKVACKSFPVDKCGSPYPITVGAGGVYNPCWPAGDPGPAQQGSNSVFSTITSAGGGRAGMGTTPTLGTPLGNGTAGGSGGGAGAVTPGGGGTAGAGNTPPTPCTQGTAGGIAHPVCGPNTAGAGAGGGHTAAGGNGGACDGGAGGAGTVCGIRGTPFDPVAYAGGGGGSSYNGTAGTAGAGGGGAGGTGTPAVAGGTGTVNSGGGGGGAGAGDGPVKAGSGGSGIVIIRRLTSSSCTTSGTVTTCGSDTIHTFTGDGTFVTQRNMVGIKYVRN